MKKKKNKKKSNTLIAKLDTSLVKFYIISYTFLISESYQVLFY